MVSARKDGDFSFMLTKWGDGIAPNDFDLPYGYSAPDNVFHTIFDRIAGPPGRDDPHEAHRPPPGGRGLRRLAPRFTGTLRLSHRGSDTQFDLPLTIDANGIGETEWTAPKGAPMGDYDVQVIRTTKGADGKDEETTSYTGQSFKVDEYRLPTMRASVAGPKEASVRPKTMPLDLFVGYLSGGGASNLPVELRIGYFEAHPSPRRL